MSNPVSDFLAYEVVFDGKDTILWTKDHAEVPVLATALYLFFIFTVPEILKKPLPLKTSFALWNLFLSVFSIMGVTRIVPHLLRTLHKEGFEYTVCHDPMEWYSKGPVGLWMAFFVYSKIPELMDTVFLVLRKKEVIFLHWFHHVTVLLYCWHAFHTTVAPGLWFAAMNFSVHSVMYFYFFMTNIGYYKLMQPIAPFITTIQILQMIGGLICLGYVAHAQIISGRFEQCKVNPANWKLGLMMYFSYFVLFSVLFMGKYITKESKSKPKKGDMQKCPPSCPTTDASGFFHPNGDSSPASSDRLVAELEVLEKRRKEIEHMLGQNGNGVKKDN